MKIGHFMGGAQGRFAVRTPAPGQPLKSANTNTRMESTSTQQPRSLGCLDIWGGIGKGYEAATVPGLNVYLWSKPAHESNLGGDIHLVSVCSCEQISRFILADVAGHGASASQVAGRLRHLMRRHINKPDQTRLASAVNKEFTQIARQGRFATVILGTFVPTEQTLTVCNAGQPTPLYYSASAKTWEFVANRAVGTSADPSNVPWGIQHPVDYSQFDLPLHDGDVVLLFSDALVEARSPFGSMLEYEGLIDLVRTLDWVRPAEALWELLRRLDVFAGAAPLRDDQTILVLHNTGGKLHPPSLARRLRMLARRFGLIRSEFRI